MSAEVISRAQAKARGLKQKGCQASHPLGAGNGSFAVIPRREKLLRPVRPNVGIEVAYRKRLLALIDRMAASYAYWIKATYRANQPIMAQDATPAIQLKTAVNRLGRYWNKRFNEASKQLAVYFTLSAQSRSDAALRTSGNSGPPKPSLGWKLHFHPGATVQLSPQRPEVRDIGMNIAGALPAAHQRTKRCVVSLVISHVT